MRTNCSCGQNHEGQLGEGGGPCLQVAPGHSILVTGPNGSGKSSLFRLLGGLWPLTNGQIRKPGSNQGALLSNDIFYVPQKPYTTIGSLREQVMQHSSRCILAIPVPRCSLLTGKASSAQVQLCSTVKYCKDVTVSAGMYKICKTIIQGNASSSTDLCITFFLSYPAMVDIFVRFMLIIVLTAEVA